MIFIIISVIRYYVSGTVPRAFHMLSLISSFAKTIIISVSQVHKLRLGELTCPRTLSLEGFHMAVQ